MVHYCLLLYVVCILSVCDPSAAFPIIKVGCGPDWQCEIFRDGGDRKPSGTAASDKLWFMVLGWGWAGDQFSVLIELCSWDHVQKLSQKIFILIFLLLNFCLTGHHLISGGVLNVSFGVHHHTLRIDCRYLKYQPGVGAALIRSQWFAGWVKQDVTCPH